MTDGEKNTNSPTRITPSQIHLQLLMYILIDRYIRGGYFICWSTFLVRCGRITISHSFTSSGTFVFSAVVFQHFDWSLLLFLYILFISPNIFKWIQTKNMEMRNLIRTAVCVYLFCFLHSVFCLFLINEKKISWTQNNNRYSCHMPHTYTVTFICRIPMCSGGWIDKKNFQQKLIIIIIVECVFYATQTVTIDLIRRIIGTIPSSISMYVWMGRLADMIMVF